MTIASLELGTKATSKIKVIMPLLPHIANRSDFEILRLHPNIDFELIQLGNYIPRANLMILPDSENVRKDLQSLKGYQWERALTRQLRDGGKILGIGRGFQMLGNAIHDTDGIEGQAGSDDAFGWLLMETRLSAKQPPKQVSGKLSFADANIKGYESYMGDNVGEALARPALWIHDKATARGEGAISIDNQVAGTTVSGLFDHAEACAALLKWASYMPS